MNSSKAKIFQIGFNKCATRALSYYFANNGYKCMDWDQGRLAQNIDADMKNGEPLLAQYPDVQVFSDMEFVRGDKIIEGYRYFKELHRSYPDALFILNTRNGEAWLRSRAKHGDGTYLDRYRKFFGVKTNSEVIEKWRFDWFQHHLDVLNYFSGELRKSLFIFDIDKPDLDGLASFVSTPLDQSLWTVRGKTKKSKSP